MQFVGSEIDSRGRAHRWHQFRDKLSARQPDLVDCEMLINVQDMGETRAGEEMEGETNSNLTIVIYVVFSLISIHILIGLSRKLPLVVNFLLFMVIDIALTNKLTIIGFNYKLFQINTKSIPHFISMILHNDFTITFVLLTFANVFLTTKKTGTRIAISVYGFAAQFFLGMTLRWNHVLTNTGWTTLMESVMIISLMAYTLILGKTFQCMASKERWIR